MKHTVTLYLAANPTIKSYSPEVLAVAQTIRAAWGRENPIPWRLNPTDPTSEEV